MLFFRKIIRKLQINNSILSLVLEVWSFLLSKVSSFRKLQWMICLILQIRSNLVGLSISKSSRNVVVSPPTVGIILAQKSAFNNSSYNRRELSLFSSSFKLIRCAQITIAYLGGVSSIESSFPQRSVLVNLNRAGKIILATDLSILFVCFRPSIWLSVKRINPSGPIRIFLIRCCVNY